MRFGHITFALGVLGLIITLSADGRPQQPNLPTWSLSSAPVLSIGGDGTPATEFLRIRTTFRLRDGLIAVVNTGSKEIRIFDAQGKHVRTFGRAGSGPGEFRSIIWAGRSDDTAFVYDDGLRRISIILLGREPRLLGSLSITGPGARGAFGVFGQRSRELVSSRDPRGRAFVEAKYSSKYLPSRLPFFESLVPGLESEVWIQEYVGGPTTQSRYLVVGSDLKPRAWVSVPKGFRVADVGHDFVLGVHDDDDGVESVRRYGLSRR